MSVSYVCFRCRRRALSRNLWLQKTRQVDRRSFLSLISIDKPKDEEALLQSSDGELKTRYPRRQYGSQDKHSRLRLSPTESSGDVNNMLEELFESTRREKPRLPPKSRYSKFLNPEPVVASHRTWPLQDDIDTINGLLQRGTSTAEIFQTIPTLPAFKSCIQGTKSRDWSVGLKPTWNEPLRELLLEVIKQRLENPSKTLSPSSAAAIQTYISYGLMVDGWWCMVLWRLLAPIVRDLGSLATSEPEVDSQRSILLIGEVLEVWKLFSTTFGQSQGPPQGSAVQLSGSPDWSGLLDLSTSTLNQASLHPIFTECFMDFFARKPASSNDSYLAISAALTGLCLRLAMQKTLLNGPLALDAKMFLDFVNHVMSKVSPNGARLRDSFVSCLRNNLKITKSTATHLYYELGIGGSRDGKPLQKVPGTNVLKADHGWKPEEVSMAIRRLSSSKIKGLSPTIEPLKAAGRSDMKAIIQMWTCHQRDLDKGLKADDAIFAEFMTAFFALGSSEYAIKVWTAMSKYGRKPTRRHWLALLDGCKITRDLDSLLSIWQRMRAAKVQLTNQAWTIYITGLLQCKDPTTALNAIQELGQAWNESLNSPSSPTSISTLDEPAKHIPAKNKSTVHEQDLLVPSIVPINAAISGFLANEQADIAKSILNWAISQSIKPDATTFNTLLRHAVRRDDNEQVSRLLQEMNRHGCNPGTITFTILFDGLIRNPRNAFQTSPPEVQQNLIDRFFADMRSNGITANARTYTIILDSLLSTQNMNIPAARALIARMAAQGIKPTPHIYTILIAHYFSLSPPDLPAIDALWRRIEFDGTSVDHVFYDRMIEGYARVGHLDKMLAFLRRMPAAGKTPGWWALLEALKTLVRAEEWDLVTDLVGDVQEGGVLGTVRVRGWRGEGEFWELVEDLRMRGLDVPRGREAEVGEGRLGTKKLGVRTGVVN